MRDVVEKHGGRVVVEHPGQIEEPAWSDSGHPRIDRRGRGEINGSQPLLKRIGCDAGPERLLVGRERLEARVQGGLPEVERAEAVASRQRFHQVSGGSVGVHDIASQSIGGGAGNGGARGQGREPSQQVRASGSRQPEHPQCPQVIVGDEHAPEAVLVHTIGLILRQPGPAVENRGRYVVEAIQEDHDIGARSAPELERKLEQALGEHVARLPEVRDRDVAHTALGESRGDLRGNRHLVARARAPHRRPAEEKDAADRTPAGDALSSPAMARAVHVDVAADVWLTAPVHIRFPLRCEAGLQLGLVGRPPRLRGVGVRHSRSSGGRHAFSDPALDAIGRLKSHQQRERDAAHRPRRAQPQPTACHPPANAIRYHLAPAMGVGCRQTGWQRHRAGRIDGFPSEWRSLTRRRRCNTHARPG